MVMCLTVSHSAVLLLNEIDPQHNFRQFTGRRRVSLTNLMAIKSTNFTVPRSFFLDVKWFFRITFLCSLCSVSSAGIGCFVCSSFNRSTPSCEDQFNSSISYPATSTASNYQFPCWAFKKDRKGLFPADHCVKVSGYQSDNPSQTLVIRTCALDSGTLTADTEIVRISHCGHFRYEGKQYTGCVQSCDTDGCNFAGPTILSSFLVASMAFGLITCKLFCITGV
ncbi:hypothetical protein M3Y96_00677200 [Aphelenchoides besseyi]|nr:hypothetical protein M3Y96_00677200 [Aphelenchoides besseyi]